MIIQSIQMESNLLSSTLIISIQSEIENLPENTEVFILNRWGNVVFSSANYLNNWDGKDTVGQELLTGVYTYKYTTQKGLTGHGFVHLVR